VRPLVRRKVTIPDGAKLVVERYWHNSETRWQIWHYTTIGNWRNLKLMAVTDKKRRKHSFYLGWNVEEQRFGEGSVLKILRRSDPKIAIWAQRMCEEHLAHRGPRKLT